jgi:hypothetical protein
MVPGSGIGFQGWTRDTVPGSEEGCQDEGKDDRIQGRMPGSGEGCQDEGRDARIRDRMPESGEE